MRFSFILIFLNYFPGTGIMRHVDAGYEKARKVARERNVKVGLVEDL